MTHIFVSYKREDREIVEQLVTLLRASFNTVWFDQNIPGGQDWVQQINQEIENCDCLLFFVSTKAVESRWCIDELKEARKRNKPIIPIQIEDKVDLPEHLHYLRALNFIKLLPPLDIYGLNGVYVALIRNLFEDPNASLSKETISYRKDKRLLQKLYPMLQKLLPKLADQVIIEFIEERLLGYIDEYQIARDNVQNRFNDTELESVFRDFDDILLDVTGKLMVHYKAEEHTIENADELHHLIPHKFNDKDLKAHAAYQQRRSELERLGYALQKQFDAIILTIKRLVPHFDMDE